MAAQKVFHVLTEFRFEVQSAVADSGKLQVAVRSISDSADSALASLSNLSGFLKSALGVNTGLFGLAGGAIQASQQLRAQSLQFANLLGGNMEFLSGDVNTFNDRLLMSKQIIKDIASVAEEFGLDEKGFLANVKLTSAMLIPKGLAGNNLENAIDLARSFEKSAPMLGVDTYQAQGQLIRAIEGSASLGDTLFKRLVLETKAFSDLGGAKSASKKFNTMDAGERFDRLRRALAQFSDDARITAANAELLGAKVTVIKNQIFGLNGVLIPLGEALEGPIKNGLDQLSNWLKGPGRVVGQQMGLFVDSLVKSPESVYINLRQLSKLKQDLKRAGNLTAFIGGTIILVEFIKGMRNLPATFARVSASIKAFALTARKYSTVLTTSASVGALPRLAALAGMLGFVGKLAGVVFTKILVPLAVLTGVFQIFSRALAIAEVDNFKFMANNSGRAAEAFNKIRNSLSIIISPFLAFADILANMFAPLFKISTWGEKALGTLEGVASGIQFVSDGFLGVFAIFHASFDTVAKFLALDLPEILGGGLHNIVAVVSTFVSDLMRSVGEAYTHAKNFEFGKAADALANPFTNPTATQLVASDVMTPQEYYMNFLDKISEMIAARENSLAGLSEDRMVTNSVTNIGSVTVRQEFKEQQEPDRIAQSLVKVLIDAAKNPTQARGRSLQAGFVR